MNFATSPPERQPRDAQAERAAPSPLPYLTGFALIATLILILGIGSLWHAYRDGQERAAIASQNLAQLLSIQLTELLTHADGVIQAVAYQYQQALEYEGVDETRFTAWLNQITRVFTGFQTIRVMDAEGVVRFGSGEIAPTSVADRDYFGLARDDPDVGLIIAGPLQTKTSKKWVIRLVRRLSRQDGRFAGMVHVNIEVDKLAELFSRLELGAGGVVVLRTLDLAQVARYPIVAGADNGVGNRKVSPRLEALIEQSSDSGHYVATAALDQVERVLAYRRLDPYPFYVIVGRSTADILAGLRASILQWSAISFLIILSAAAGMWRLYRSAWQERALHVKARSAAIFEASPLPMLLVAQDGRIRLFNQAATQLFGYDSARLHALSIEQLLPRLALDAPCATADCPVRRRDEPVAIRQDGHQLPVKVACTRRMLDGLQQCILVVQDITAEREQQEAMRAAKLAAEAANAAKSQFLANMSHEIRTPMNAVLGLAQVLEQGALSADQRDLIRQIRVAGRSLLGIIDDILDLSKIEAGQLQIEPSPFVLAPLLEQLAALFGPTARAKGLALEIGPAPTLDGVLVGDALRLEQIITNLVGNAVKFTERGTIAVRVAIQDPEAAVVRLRCEVSDTGIGIDPAAIDSLFAPFTQAETGITRRFGGTGLGLSICKRLVELMGGEIGLMSQVGEGSTFWFELPLARVADAKAMPLPVAAGTRSSGARLSGLWLLVVDDNAMNLDVGERMLRLEGARATRAMDGRQALAALRERPQGFDAVLMDVQMPVLDGLSATRAIRGELGLTRLPVIAVTAGVLAAERERARAAGVDDFLTKPLELDQLVATLLRWVRPSALAAASIPVLAEVSREVAPTRVVLPRIVGIDQPRAELLARGDADFYHRLLRGFVSEATDVDNQVRTDLEQGALERAAARLHRLRGAAANLGALELARSAQSLEGSIQNGDLGEWGESLIAFSTRLAALLDSASHWLTETRSPRIAEASAETLDLAKLAALREALDLNQPRPARRLFTELEAGLVGVYGAETAGSLAAAIAALRFDAALAILDKSDQRLP